MPTREEADEIVSEPKLITENLSWRQQKSRFRSYRLEGTVLIPRRDELARISAHVGKSNFNFSLLYGNQPIRRCHKGFQHKNPDDTRVGGLHKHTWDEADEDQWAYKPEGFPDSDPHQAFMEFLKEVNIELKGNYVPFMM